MFLGGFKESTQKEVVLEEVEPDTMAALLEFIYTGTFSFSFINFEKILVSNFFL
jgi:hypothetical protein